MPKLKQPKKKLRKETSINIRLTLKERQQIQVLADAADMPLTTYAREALLEVIAYFATDTPNKTT